MASQCNKCSTTNVVRTCSACGYLFCSKCDKAEYSKYPRGKTWSGGSNWCPKCGKVNTLKIEGKRGNW